MRRNDSTLKPIFSLGAIALIPVVLVGVLLALVGGRVEQAPAQAEVPGAAEKGLRVYVVVLDGLMAHEIREPLTPTLAGLKSNGTWYEEARAVFPAETIPNHVAMMTGVPPNRNGIVGNDYWAPNADNISKYRMQYPSLLGADTLTTRLENRCTISTATITSKGYLYGVFRGEPAAPAGLANEQDPARPDPANPQNQRQADLHWDPRTGTGYINDPDDHVIDQTTMDTVLKWVDGDPEPPQFAFVNLGDIDRSGHIDMSGNAGGVSAFRQAALADTDQQVKRLIDDLKASGAWQQTVLIFTSDHGMDWSVPDGTVNRQGTTASLQSIDITRILSSAMDKDGNPATLEEPGYTQDAKGAPGRITATSLGDFNVVPGGGTATVWMEEDATIEHAAKKILAYRTPAGESPVDFIASREPIQGLDNPTFDELEMDHSNNGDFVVFAKQHWAVRDSASTNPIPGNHGHAPTQHSVLMVTGGSPLLDDTPQEVEGPEVWDPPTTPFSKPSGGPGNLSVAPTVAALFGIGPPTGGYARGPLTDAFKSYALAPHTACQAASPPQAPPPTTGGNEPPDQGGTTRPPATSPRPSEEPLVSPRLARLRVTPDSFFARASRPGTARVRAGAIVRYRSTQRARTLFTVRRRRNNGTYGRARSFIRRTAVGRNAFRFTGWVDGRKLRRGAYRMRAVARNSAGRSNVVRDAFRIVRR
jgi:phosphonoacetate hydrolase